MNVGGDMRRDCVVVQRAELAGNIYGEDRVPRLQKKITTLVREIRTESQFI